MQYERDSQTLGRETEALRQRAVAKANAWTNRLAERLNTSSGVILEAIRERGWLPEDIEAVSSRYYLENDPPMLKGVEGWVDVELDRKARAKVKARDTAMSEAFRQAAE